MKINTDINILGGISDLNIISSLLNTDKNNLAKSTNIFTEQKRSFDKFVRKVAEMLNVRLLFDFLLGEAYV